jgi:hypothetical protein
MAKIIGTTLADIADLNYFEGNSKKHNIQTLMESILLHGFFQTILVCKRQNSVLGGNGRLEALRSLQANPKDAGNIIAELQHRYNNDIEIVYPPNGITIDGDRWLVNVLEVETISDAEAIAINLQDNLSVLDGGDFTALDQTRAFDVDGLLAQLESLKELNFLPVSLDNDDVDSLLRAIEAGDEDELEDDGFDDGDHMMECPKCGHQWK